MANYHNLGAQCLTCKFAHRTDRDGERECHRHPPRPHPEGVPLVWPVMDDNDWCGDYKHGPQE